MAKKSDKDLLKRVAVFTGHLAGSVEGLVERAHHLGEPLPEPKHEDIRWERSDLNFRGVLLGGVGILAGMWLSIALLFFYFNFLKQHRADVSPPPLPIASGANPLPPAPRLQASPRQDLNTFQAQQTWELTHYYWLDKSKGQVAIPIEQAIRMLARRSIPPQNGLANPTSTPPEDGTRLTGFEGKVAPEVR